MNTTQCTVCVRPDILANSWFKVDQRSERYTNVIFIEDCVSLTDSLYIILLYIINKESGGCQLCCLSFINAHMNFSGFSFKTGKE